MMRSVRDDRLYRHASVAGDDIQRTAERQYSLAHADQAEAGLVIRRQTATVVADAHYGAAAISIHSCGLLDRDADGGRVGVAEGVRQGFLNDAVNRQVGDFSGLIRPPPKSLSAVICCLAKDSVKDRRENNPMANSFFILFWWREIKIWIFLCFC